ncbi:MAG TPA: imidazole glycerol phosphate synthase subunit HisH [Gemmatimonadaceae bacterium]
MKVVIFDYGAGNLHSLAKALDLPGAEVVIETDPTRATAADALVLPGVGAFGAATEALAPGRDAMRAAVMAGLPTLGICLGMQLLFEESQEGSGAGLGVIPGRVERLRAQRVPEIGWNALDERRDPLLVSSGLEVAYYAHSYVCRPADPGVVTSWTTHEGDRFAASVRTGPAGRDNIVGVQFHPEKSSTAGVQFVRAFLEAVRG